MKNKSILTVLTLSFILTGCVGIIERRPTAIYVEPRPAVIVAEPVEEVVIINGCPIRRLIVAPRPIVIHRHHH